MWLSPKTITIPVVFHNLQGYDSHMLYQVMSRVEGKILCIHNNTEKYISFSPGQLRFVESAQFLLASLDKACGSKQARGIPELQTVRVTKRKVPAAAVQGSLPIQVYGLLEAVSQSPSSHQLGQSILSCPMSKSPRRTMHMLNRSGSRLPNPGELPQPLQLHKCAPPC